jgi:transposase
MSETPHDQRAEMTVEHYTQIRCPRCGAKDTNDASLGGNERCWHCVCGYVECAEEPFAEASR